MTDGIHFCLLQSNGETLFICHQNPGLQHIIERFSWPLLDHVLDLRQGEANARRFDSILNGIQKVERNFGVGAFFVRPRFCKWVTPCPSADLKRENVSAPLLICSLYDCAPILSLSLSFVSHTWYNIDSFRCYLSLALSLILARYDIKKFSNLLFHATSLPVFHTRNGIPYEHIVCYLMLVLPKQ